MIEVTTEANQAIKEFMADKNLTGSLRVHLENGGCSGPSLRLVLDDERDGDDVFEAEGLTFLINKDLGEVTGDVKVEFITEGGQSGFLLSTTNPLPSAEGGCGGGCSCGC